MSRLSPTEVRSAQSRIFNKLCTTFLHGKDRAFLRANDIQKELDITADALAEALQLFRDGDRSVIEVFENDGETYLRLGESSLYNLADFDD
jgi:hypothetical protein